MPSAEGLVGREVELALAAAAVHDLSEGRASALVIEGEAGIGKTRLVECVVDDARSRGVAVYDGQAHPFERTRPFGVVAAALGLSRRSPDPRRAAIGELLGGRGMGGLRPPPATSSTGSSRKSLTWSRARAPRARCFSWPRTSTGPTAQAS
jgi:hypothetical protein